MFRPRRHSKVAHLSLNCLSSPPGGLFFLKHFKGGGGGCLKEIGGLFNLAKCIKGSKVSPGRTGSQVAEDSNLYRADKSTKLCMVVA